MSRPLIIRPEAEEDMIEARNWYEHHDEMGAAFLTAIEEVLERIRENPELYAREYKSVRRAVPHRFPYVVYYRLVGEAVEIIAVQHGSRHPRNWQSRL